MKKIMSLVVLALFVCSIIPIALADESENTTKNQPLKAKIQEVKEKRNEMKQIGIERKGIVDETRTQKKELRSENTELKLQLREKIKACKNDSSQCKELKTQMKANVQERLIISADEIISLMENLKEKIQALNPSNKDKLIDAVDADIAKVQEIKTKLEALPSDAKASELNALAKELKDIWKEARKTVRINAVRMLAIGFEQVLAKAEKLETRLDNVIIKLKEKGYDTAAASAKVEEFKTHIQSARDSYNEAKTQLEAYQSNPNLESAVQAIQEKMQAARKELQLAQQSLKEAVKLIKEQKEGTAILEATPETG